MADTRRARIRHILSILHLTLGMLLAGVVAWNLASASWRAPLLILTLWIWTNGALYLEMGRAEAEGHPKKAHAIRFVYRLNFLTFPAWIVLTYLLGRMISQG